eukprot:3825505-Pyramimonas_sp.AAC.1
MVAMGSMPAGPPAAPAIPPSRCEMGESTLERQARIRPSVTPPIISAVISPSVPCALKSLCATA